MKDSYSFDIDEAGLDKSFDAHRAAYERIFARLGIPAIAVEASNGTMGGSDSIEFMCPSEAGEDLVATCPNCHYAANLEKATSALPPVAGRARHGRAGTAGHARRAHHRGPVSEIRHRGRTADQDARPGGERAADARLLRGDHPLADQKLIDATGVADIRPAQPEEIRAALGASPGSLGAVGVTSLPVIADLALRGRRDMATGANTDDVHLTGVDVARDITVTTWADLREVAAGEPCPRCGTPLELIQAIEVGHIFKLGRKFTTVLGVSVLGPDGSAIVPDHGLLRHRSRACHGGHRRGAPRRRGPAVAGQRGARRDHGDPGVDQGRGRHRRCRRRSTRRCRRRARTCCSTTGTSGQG